MTDSRNLSAALLALLALASCKDAPAPGWSGYAEGDYVYVAAPVAGRLQQLTVQAGDQVKGGAPLFALDVTNEREAAAAAQAQASAAQAQAANLEETAASMEQITGTVKEKGQPDQPLVRQVLLYSENTHVLVASTWSQADGTYRFERIDPQQCYTVISTDYRQLYRAVIADNLRPELMP